MDDTEPVGQQDYGQPPGLQRLLDVIGAENAPTFELARSYVKVVHNLASACGMAGPMTTKDSQSSSATCRLRLMSSGHAAHPALPREALAQRLGRHVRCIAAAGTPRGAGSLVWSIAGQDITGCGQRTAHCGLAAAMPRSLKRRPGPGSAIGTA